MLKKYSGISRELWTVLKNNGALGNLQFYLNERGPGWEQERRRRVSSGADEGD